MAHHVTTGAPTLDGRVVILRTTNDEMSSIRWIAFADWTQLTDTTQLAGALMPQVHYNGVTPRN